MKHNPVTERITPSALRWTFSNIMSVVSSLGVEVCHLYQVFSHVVLSLISPAEWYKLLYLRKSRACWLFNFKDIFSYMVKNKQFSEADQENQM